ncbi:hypothetical protein PybrP1_010965 [[Pythium] brassicae (nom. inval.)]|nr:hypothetical protein PybrP1_010965 [[Pythium] brassicae (nom. inval.)]
MDSVAVVGGLDVSALDERRYECLELPNALQVLLISDPKTEKASAALDVHVGHQSDPAELPGLAHFLEHMLFLGTAKYPDENSYKAFLSAHSGRSNASTSAMHTNYYFDVLAEHLEEALDRFAQFFVAPLFTPGATEREMHAVDSENAKNLQNDHRRLYQLEKSLASPAHPFHKFGTGNLATLGHGPKARGLDVRQALLDFHAAHYSASIMKLVVYGKEDLATLARWATERFAAVRSSGRSFPTFGGAVPFDGPRLARRVHVAPVKDVRSIALAWPLPPLHYEFLAKPSKVLSHLLGHEGRGSLLSFLKAQEWANGLSAGLTRDHEDWSLFSVTVDATDAGIAHADDVVTAVYQYVRLLRGKAPLPRWIFEEAQALSLVAFRFKSKESPMSYTSALAGAMHRYPTKYIVSGAHVLYGYDAGKVQEILDALTPARMRLTVVSRAFAGTTQAEERWYGTPYTDAPLPDALLARWANVKGNRALQLPPRNEFICSDFAIVTPPAVSPVAGAPADVAPALLGSDALGRLWFKADTQFRKPKASLSFLLYAPALALSPHHAVLAGLFVRYLKDELTELAYDAELAGVHYDVSVGARALELSVGGFSHKLPALLAHVLRALVRLARPGAALQDAVFARVQDRTQRLYANFFREEPYQHAVYSASLLLEAAKWSVEDKAAAAAQLTARDLAAFAQHQLFQQLFVEGFAYGNLTPDAAREAHRSVLAAFGLGTGSVRGSLPLLPSQVRKPRIVQLAAGAAYVLARRGWHAENRNSALCALFQVSEAAAADASMALRARLELFAHVVREPCFHQLRTQEQLGYLVFSGVVRFEGVAYFRVLVQSSVADPALLDQRVEVFVGGLRDALAALPRAAWATQVTAVVKALEEKPKRESEEAARCWREIANETYVFDRRQRVAALVAALQPSDLLAFYDAYLAPGGPQRSKLSVRLYGAAHPLPELELEATTAASAVTGLTAALQLGDQQAAGVAPRSPAFIRDIDAFKRRMPLFPERSHDGLVSALALAAEAPAKLAQLPAQQLNGMLVSSASTGLVAFAAGSIGGGGVLTAALLALLAVLGALWTMTAGRARAAVPSFKGVRTVDGAPSDIFLYLMNVKNYPVWDASVERAEVVHTIDDHSDIIHIVYRPVWIWPVWIAPRDLCLLRYWRRAEDGSYVICLQSAIHPECPPTHGVVRAKSNGGGFTISPRAAALAQSEEHTSMVANVVHLDPLGWEGKLLQRMNCMHVYLRPQLLALTGLQEVMEARKFVCPNVPEAFSAAMASAESAAGAAAAAEQAGGIGNGAATGAGAVAPLQELPCNVPRSMWAEPDGTAMMVRGPDYLTDRRKIPSAPPAFRLMGMDLFSSSHAIEHIASRADNIVQKELARHEAQGSEMPFTFVINFVVPGNPRINLVLYYQAPSPAVLADGSPFADLMAAFLDGTDDFRDERFKLIPCIVEGSFIVRQAVGSTPAIIGKKLRQPCYRGKQYFELDVDIGSSAVANRVVGLVSGYTKKLVIDMGFLVEGQRSDELPERLFGTVRLLYIDLSIAVKLD